MAGLGIKLTPEETADAFKGLKLSPDEMTSSKYPQPRSMTANDEDLGLRVGPVTSARIPGTALSLPLRPSMSEVESEHLNDQAIDAAQRMESTAGAAAAGGMLGTVARGAVAGAETPGLARAGGAMMNALSGPQASTAGALLGIGSGQGITGTIMGLLAPQALRAIGAMVPPTLTAGTAALPSLGAVGVGGAAMGDKEPPDEALRRVARMLMGGKPLGQGPTFPQGE